MRHLSLAILVLLTSVGIVAGQARTAERIVDVTIDRLDPTGSLPNGSVRHLIAGLQGTTPCTIGGTGALAMKINGVWECPKMTPGIGTGDVLGTSASSVGEIVLFSSTNGKNIGRSNSLNGIPFLTNGVITTLASSGSGSVVRDSAPTLTNPALITPTIASFANAAHSHADSAGGGQLNASNVFNTGTIPPARIISNGIVNSRCLRVSNVGAIEVAAFDCGAGGGGTPGGVSGNLAYNESGTFGALSNTAFDSSTGRLTFTQKANGNDTLNLLRFTDTSPTGSLLRARNAANSTDLIVINADGSVYLSAATTLKTVAAPSTPASGNSVMWADSTTKNLRVQDDAGNVSGTVRAITCSSTDKISAISSAGVPTCTADQSTAGSGVITLNTLTASDQTFVDVDDTNVTLSIVSATSTHTFTLGWSGTLAKARQNGATVYNDAANTWTTGAQDFGSVSSLKVPSATGATPSASGLVAYDLTSNTLEYGENGTNRTVVNTAGSQTLDNKTLANTTVANLRDTLLTIQDNTDPTKTVNFELGGITSGQNRVVTVADANSVTVQPTTATTNQFVTHIDSAGVVQKAQPSFSNLSGSMGPTQGGTGLTSVAQGDLLYGDNTNSWARLAKDTNATRVLTNTGASNNPAWAQLSLTTGVTGILPVANGGTNNAFFTVSGPATSAKTYTFPNSNATILTDVALVTAAQGGTNNGFFQVSGPATSTKTFTFPNASAAVLTDNAAVTIAQGGTGQTSQTAAFNALDPLTTKGDLLTHDGTNSIRLATGTNGFVLTADSTQTAGVKWAAAVASAGGSTTQLQYNNSGALGGISGAATDGTSVTFAPASIIIGGQSATPTAVAGAFYRDTDDTKLYWAIDGSTWGEVFVSGVSVVNLNSANVTSTLQVANGGTGVTALSFTVATLPTGVTGRQAYVTDGSTSSDCTTGGGSNKVLCIYNGSAWTQTGGGSGTPGGSNTQVQYNNAGVFGGDAGMTYNASTDTLTLAGALVVSGSSAGYLELAEGTAPSLVANRVQHVAATDAPAGGIAYLWGSTAAASGVLRVANSSGTMTVTQDAGISHLASSTSADLAGVLSDETGSSGGFARAGTPTITTPVFTAYTVATLPAAGTAGRLAVVTDASAAGSCTSGGGSSLAFCRDSGSAWAPVGDGGSGGGGTPGGSDTQVQFNSSGSFAGDAGFTYNASTDTATIGALALSGSGAGYVELAEGSAPSLVANRFQIFAPADVAAGGLSFILPAAGATGYLKATNSSGTMTLSIDSTTFEPADVDLDALAALSTNGLIAHTGAGTVAARTIQGTSNEITVSNGSGASGDPSLSLSSTLNLSSKTVRVPNSTTLPTNCTTGDMYMDTDATSGQRFYLCQATDTWVVQGDGGGSGVINSGSTNAIAKYVGSTTIDDSATLSEDGTTLTYSGTGGLSLTATGGGYIQLTEGTPPSIVANTVQLAVASDAPAGGVQYLFGSTAAASGVLRVANSSGVMTVTQDAGISHLASSTSADLAGVLSDEQGSGGGFVRATSPTLTTPNIGVATATSVNGLTITTSTGTLTVTNGKTASFSNSITFAGTDSTTQTFQATDTIVGRATTDVLTNKTYDTSGTGNVFTSTHKIWLPAAGCNNTSASTFWDLPTSTPAVAVCVTGTNTQVGALDFADTSGGFSAQNTLILPGDFSGTIDARIIWSTSATSGNVKWSLSTICTAVDATETDDPAFNTASTVTTAAPGVANRLQTSSITSVTITGCAANEVMHVKIFRDGNDGSDTISATARLRGVELTTTRAQ